MNFSNFQNLNNQHFNDSYRPSELTVLIVNILFYIDTVIRIFSAIAHLFYFGLIVYISDLRNRTLLYVHHANLIGFLFNLHYIYYFNYVHPNFNDSNLNNILCELSEIIWAMLKTLRTYSIALIAIYRLIAVFKPNMFKKINKSILYLLMGILIIYLICSVLYLGPKYGLDTTNSYLYCFDGYSPNYSKSFTYFLIQSLLGIITPISFTLIVYVLVIIRLKQNNMLVRSKPNEEFSRNKKKEILRENLKQNRLAKQMYLINICELVSSLMVIGLGLRYSIQNFNDYYSVGRFLLRTLNLLFQSFIPIVSIIYNPNVNKNFQSIKQKLFRLPVQNKFNDSHQNTPYSLELI